MSEVRLLIPIRNRRLTGLPGAPWSLSDAVTIDTIEDLDHAALLREGDGYGLNTVAIDSRVAYVRGLAARPSETDCARIAAIVQFVLNFFATEPGACVSVAAWMTTGRKGRMTVSHIYDLQKAPVAAARTTQHVRMGPKTSRPGLRSLFVACDKATLAFPGSILAVNRFSRAVSRDDEADRLVDLCIALESLLAGKDELRFRFSLLHALVGEPDPTKRLATFELFRDLYDARSAVVHGDASGDKKVKSTFDKWGDLLAFSKSSLAYYFSFLGTSTRPAWDEHVRKLALGIDAPAR